MELLYDQKFHFWVYIWRDKHQLKRYVHPYVHCSNIYNSHNMEAGQVPISRWTDKEMYIYKKLYTVECYSAIKVNENLPFTTWMDLEDIMLSKINQTEKDKDLMTSCRLPLKCVSHLSHIWLFVTPWTVACQAPLSMQFSRQDYWSG